MKKTPNYAKGTAWGAFFGVIALVLQQLAGKDSPRTIPYYLGGALMGALIGFVVVKVRAGWRGA